MRPFDPDDQGASRTGAIENRIGTWGRQGPVTGRFNQAERRSTFATSGAKESSSKGVGRPIMRRIIAFLSGLAAVVLSAGAASKW